MADTPLRILLTNDDGIHAPGLKALEAIAASLSEDVWVVAPATEQSGASHSLTLHVPLRLDQISDRRFAVHGTPTDCVMMAINHILPSEEDSRPFDLVLSGVNRGANMAEDVTYSGTVAGAMEGTSFGVPSIALSQTYGFLPGEEAKWETAVEWAPKLIKKLIAGAWPKGVLVNINFPDCAPGQVSGVDVTRQGRRDQSLLAIDHRVDARGHDYFWLGFSRVRSNPPEGTDIHSIYSGRISVTPLHLDLTEHSTVKALQDLLGD